MFPTARNRPAGAERESPAAEGVQEQTMDVDYSVEIQNRLAEEVRKAGLHRPPRIGRYKPGTELVYDVTALDTGAEARVRLAVDKFVGGGFAGQVYRVKVLEIQPGGAAGGPGSTAAGDGAADAAGDAGRKPAAIGGIEVGGTYAMKILIPPSGFSRFFRNFLYWVGFQGPFQLQVNPAAARAGALWQKFIRRAATRRFGDDRSVNDIHVTFVDKTMGSCGELSGWVDGRTWHLEVDDRLDLLRKWLRRKPVDEDRVGSPEFRAKHEFMHQFVGLLHEMGGPPRQ